MLHAIRLEIAPRNESNFNVADRHRGRGKWATIEDRQFRDRLARNVHRQNLLAATHGSLEYADVPLSNDVQPVARLAF
jgi:hypothetical protein